MTLQINKAEERQKIRESANRLKEYIFGDEHFGTVGWGGNRFIVYYWKNPLRKIPKKWENNIVESIKQEEPPQTYKEGNSDLSQIS